MQSSFVTVRSHQTRTERFAIVPSDRSEKTYTFQVMDKKEQTYCLVLQMASLVGTKKAIEIEEGSSLLESCTRNRNSRRSSKENGHVSGSSTHTILQEIQPRSTGKNSIPRQEISNNDDVLFEALQKKYGPEPKVEEIERMHELRHASNHETQNDFCIMAVLSNTINSDSCGLKQQGRVVGEVAMAMAKIKKTNEILREIFTTCRVSTSRNMGRTYSKLYDCLLLCEFVTFDEEEVLSQEAKEEDEDDDEIPKEKAMDGMLRVLLELTQRFPLESNEEPLRMWSQLSRPNNIDAIVNYVVNVCLKRPARVLHEIVNVVFRTQPQRTANVLIQILDTCTKMKDPLEWRKNAMTTMRILIPLVMIDCNALLPYMSDILIHSLIQMPSDLSNIRGMSFYTRKD